MRIFMSQVLSVRKMYRGHTLPQGFAMKVGMMPFLIPTLFATYLNRLALSAMRRAVVYARAVSYTPGPVSVSAGNSGWSMKVETGLRLTMALDWNLKCKAGIKKLLEVRIVKLCP